MNVVGLPDLARGLAGYELLIPLVSTHDHVDEVLIVPPFRDRIELADQNLARPTAVLDADG